jgi:hypothetical protein
MSNPNPSFTNINPNNPLTIQHLDQIKLALRALDQAESAAELAQAAGIEVTAQLQTIQDQRTQLLKIKNVYFPGQ